MAYEGSTASEVWQEIKKMPYADPLPHDKVNLHRMVTWYGKSRLKNAAERTLSDQSDILPDFDKLVHPNGVCLKGEWLITASTPYTGYFSQGARAVIVARASVALSDTERGEYRGFGMAGKLFPTDDFNHSNLLRTANFFVIDDLSGTKISHYQLSKMTNAPDISFRPSSLLMAPLAIITGVVFAATDNNPNERPLYPISQLGLEPAANAVTPYRMRISGADGQILAEPRDFRKELIESTQLNHNLVFNIETTGIAEEKLSDNDDWKLIGQIQFQEAMASYGCDHRLHFAHPKSK